MKRDGKAAKRSSQLRSDAFKCRAEKSVNLTAPMQDELHPQPFQAVAEGTRVMTHTVTSSNIQEGKLDCSVAI